MITENVENLGLNSRLVGRFLSLRGWKNRILKSDRKLLWLTDDAASDQIEVLLSYNEKTEQRDLNFAIATIAQYYEKSVVDISQEIRALAFDVITSRIPDTYVRNDSIELRIASEYIEKMKELLAAAASTELSGERSFQRLRKDGIDFSEKCRFGHTFRGGFGFQIESPVGLNDEPSFEITDDQKPFGRKVIERISRGLSSLQDAERRNDIEPVVKNSSGFSSNMCDVMVKIIKDIGISRVDIGIRFSPEWQTDFQGDAFVLTSKHADLLEEASRQLRVKEEPKDAKQKNEIARLTQALEKATAEKAKLLADLKWMRGEK